MLKALMGKEDRMQYQTGHFSRDENYKNESNGNDRNQNTVNKNEECFNGLIYRFDVDKGRIHKLKDRLIEITRSKKEKSEQNSAVLI